MSLLLLFVIAAIIVFWMVAPREKIALFWNSAVVRYPYAPQASSSELLNLQAQINRDEQQFKTLTKGAEKAIVFAQPERPQKTRFCILYVHGFSACRQELSPVPEQVAKELNANYFGTRLTGHGLGSDALGAAKPSDWIFDINEAFQVARTLGEKVIVISTSTGGTLTTWMAQQMECQKALGALIFISPNYGPKHWASPMFLWPFARRWLPLLSGETYGWEPESESSATYWTYRYPVSVLFGMNALVQSVQKSAIERITTPSLFLYSDHDRTVQSKLTDKVFRRWGARVKHRIAVPAVDDDTNHVTAGDITRPENNDMFISEILGFIKRHAKD